jgi:acyl-CoA-binding protein
MDFSSVSYSNDRSMLTYCSCLHCLEATVGDNNTSKPGMFDMKGKYKWEAWEANKGKSKEAAQQEYIVLVQNLKAQQ